MLECSWDELWNKVQQAQDLDHIIAAHEVFLDTIISRCLLDNNSRVTHNTLETYWNDAIATLGTVPYVSPVQSLLNQLRAIFDQIIEFQSAQDSLYRSALEELALRLQYEERKQQREEEVRQGREWGYSEIQSEQTGRRKRFFKNSYHFRVSGEWRLSRKQRSKRGFTSSRKPYQRCVRSSES